MSKKLFTKLFVFLLVVGLLFAVAPTKQALAQSPSVWDGTYPAAKPAGMLDPATGVQEVHTAEEFAWLASQPNMFTSGVTTVKLMVDINLDSKPWTPSNALGGGLANTFDGNGHTISNLTVNVVNTTDDIVHAAMFLQSSYDMPLIKQLIVDGANVSVTAGNLKQGYAGVVASGVDWHGSFQNVTVKNASVTGTKYVGGIASYNSLDWINCTVTNVTLNVIEHFKPDGTSRDLPHVGALVGLDNAGQVYGNTVSNLTIIVTPPSGQPDRTDRIGALIGTAQPEVLVGANNVSGVTLNGAPYTKLIGLDQRTYKVVNTTQMLGYTTIQAAIDAAADDDVIEVGPGTYNEAVIINKPNLTIRSTTGAASTIIDVPDGSLTTGVKFVGTNLGVLTFDGFTVKDFTEQGIVQGMGSATGTTVHVLNNVVIPAGTYLRNGIQVSGDGSTVIGNTVSNAYLTTDWGGTAIHVVNASNVIVRGNTVNGNGDVAIAIDNYNAALVSNILIENNIIAGSDVAINITGGPDTTGKIVSRVTITGNDLGNSLEGIDVSYVTLTGANTFEKNDFSGNTTYIAIYKDGYPTWGYPGANVTGTIDASPNWYGTALGPTLTNFYDDQLADPFAFDDPADFTYKPWCANAACTEFLPAMATIAPVAPIVCGVTPTTTIDVNISGIPTGMIAQGYQLTLHFNPAKTSIASVDDIAQGGFLPLSTGFTVRTIDNVNGTVVIASTIFGTASNDPSKPLAKITLTHLGVTGDIALSLSDVLLSDADGQPIPADVSPTPVVLTLQPAVMNTTKSLGYCDLASAVAGATAGDNIQLLADITIPATVTVDKALSLDLNGKVASYPQTDNSFVLRVDGASASLTINDTSDPDTGAIRAIDVDNAWEGRGINVLNGGSLIVNGGSIQGEYASVYVRAGSSMVLNGGTIGGVNGTIEYSGIVILGNGTPGSAALTVNGGVIDSYDFAISGNGTAGYTGTSIQINAGTITADATALYLPQDGVVNIAGGTITAPTAIEVKSGDLNVSGGTITGTGPYVATPSLVAGYSTDTGDAIFITSQTGYAGGINVNITGGTIQSTNSWAMREYYLSTQDFKVDKISVSNGTFTGGAGAVTFSSQLASGGLTDLALTGGLYNTDPAYPDVFVFVPYGTVYNTTVSMYEIVGISLNVHDFYYNNSGTLRGVSTDFTVTNFLISEASSVTVNLYSGVEGAYVLQQTNVLKTPTSWNVATLTSSFDYFGTYVSNSWTNSDAAGFDPTLAPTRVEVIIVLPGGTLTGFNNLPTGDRTTILPSVSGLVTLQGILAPRAGVPIYLTSGLLVRDTTSTAMTDINYWFTGVETLTYTFTTSQPRYLNVTTASGKTFLVNRDLTLTPLRLYGGDVDQNNEIQVNDASLVGQNWGSTTDPEANINYDGIVNIQDLALVGGNFGMTSATAYNWWSPLP